MTVPTNEYLPLTIVIVNDSPRGEGGDDVYLAQHIEEHGLVNPIMLMRTDKPGHYQMVNGFRRLKIVRQLKAEGRWLPDTIAAWIYPCDPNYRELLCDHSNDTFKK